MAHAPKTPFMINVRDIVGKPGQMREIELDVSFAERVGEALAAIQPGSDVHIDVRLESVHEGILATGVAEMTADAECGRCLTRFDLPMEIDFVELFAYDRSEDSDYQVVDDFVDLQPVVRDAAVLELPFQPVCRPDCAGLDPDTGERLAPGTERAPEERIDPRWAALEGFAPEDNDASASSQTRE